MIVRWDFAFACALAAGLHVAGLGLMSSGGAFDGAGNDGAQIVTLQAAPDGVAEMVAEWDRQPQADMTAPTASQVPEVELPAPKREVWSDHMPVAAPAALPAPPQLARSALPRQTAPLARAAPDAPASPSVVAPMPEAPQRLAALDVISAPRADVAPMRDAIEPPSPPEVAVSAAMRPAPRPAPKAAPSPQSAPAMVARGTGGGVSAGLRGEAAQVQTSAVSAAASKAATARWATDIQSRIARFQRYPRDARGEGRVRLRMTILADGRLGAVEVDRSSGAAAFDRAAVRAAQAAAPFPAAPKGLGRDHFVFAQWVSFSR